MDDMKKMRRRRLLDLEDLGVFNDGEEVCFQIEQKWFCKHTVGRLAVLALNLTSLGGY